LLCSGCRTRPLAFIAVFGSRSYKDQDEGALWYFGIKDGLRSTSSPKLAVLMRRVWRNGSELRWSEVATS
jgi:hypothetical protein